MAKHDPDLSVVFHALSDPTRRSMLGRLNSGQVAVTDLARPTGLALPTVMRHLAVLTDAGLIATEKSGRTRMCRARPEALAATVQWLNQQRALWEARTDRLESYIENLQKGTTP
jgi:DNA-binding transcriptional ArsR family regulator